MPMTASPPSLLLFLAHTEHVHTMLRLSLSWHCTGFNQAAAILTLLTTLWANHTNEADYALYDTVPHPCKSSMMQTSSHPYTSL